MKKDFKDQLNNPLSIRFPPKRIVSLVPSQTELLADLGLDAEVVGITKFCILPPEWVKRKVIVGGTKNFDIHKIEDLQPDLVIGNKEENTQEGILALKQKFPVWVSDILTLKDALSMIAAIGEITDSRKKASAIINSIENSFSELPLIAKEPRLSVLYLIWRKPWMGVAGNTFIDSMLKAIGYTNCLEERQRYPELTTGDISACKPDLIFLSSEPYPFREKHIDELKQISPHSQVALVDGQMFSWYGSRLTNAPQYFKSLPGINGST